ncbi:MAG TPA: aminotransferase class III-fold pyridoxal phosphate-dependent enzyme [Polyangia bacterium]|nr:aminotransferase class III-fold pyridoxal phosphate-dependent enzyme [Polyangia bacterium]
MTTAKTYEETLRDLLQADERLVVLTAENRAAIRHLPAAIGERFIDVGICEQTMVGMAAGLALRGRIPVLHALATFLTLRAFEFIRTDVGIAGLPVKLVGGVPGFLSDGNGPTHQAIDDVSVMRTIPGMQIFCPADDVELAAALPSVLRSPAPTYIRFNARPSAIVHAPFALGRAEVLTPGDDVAVLAAGMLVPGAFEACLALGQQGLGARMINLRTLAPVDEAAVLDAARTCRLLVTVEDHLLVGGTYQIVTEILARNRVPVPVVPFGLPGRWFKPGRLPDVLEHEGFSAGKLTARIAAAFEEHADQGPGGGTRTRRTRPAPSTPTIAESDALYARGAALIPGATQTLAKGVGQHVRGVAPKYIRSGRGARVVDVDDNSYLDFTMGIGPLVLGYRHPAVDAAIRAQLESGITFSLPHPLEVEVAELVHEIVPGAEQVRYGKNGCDVTTAAVRLARAFTGRDKVLCCGYHGWHDWYISVTDRNRGIPAGVAALTHTFDYNDLASVEAGLDDDTACVILEPVTFEAPKPGFLTELKRLCAARGALLIFDEMWTGFRLALGGAQERFGVTADLACFSKAVANGMPLSLLTGRADVMRLCEKDVFFFSTFGGEALSLAAAKATLRELRDGEVPARLDALGTVLREGYNALAEELGVLPFTRCVGFGCRTMVTFAPQGTAAGADPLHMKSFVQQELIRRGILWSGFHNLSAAHTHEDIALTLATYREVLPLLHEVLEHRSLAQALLGPPMEPVFRRTGGFNLKPAVAKDERQGRDARA